MQFIQNRAGRQNQIGVGVIGLGARGFKSARDALCLPQVGLVLGCDIREDRRHQAAKELKIHVEKDWRNVGNSLAMRSNSRTYMGTKLFLDQRMSHEKRIITHLLSSLNCPFRINSTFISVSSSMSPL